MFLQTPITKLAFLACVYCNMNDVLSTAGGSARETNKTILWVSSLGTSRTFDKRRQCRSLPALVGELPRGHLLPFVSLAQLCQQQRRLLKPCRRHVLL